MKGEKVGRSLTGEGARELVGDSEAGAGFTVLESIGVLESVGVLEARGVLATVGFKGAFVAVLGVTGLGRTDADVGGLLEAADVGVLVVVDMCLDMPFGAGRFFSSLSRDDVTEPASELAALLFETLLLVAAR